MKRHGTAWKLGISAALLALMGLSAGAFYARRATASPDVATAAVSRGSIVAAVSASGTLEAVTTVQVGTQVSGTVQTLYADFNSIVRKGQVLARLDPSLFQTEIQQASANLERAEAEVERLQVALADARTKATRARELAARQLIPASDLDSAETTARSAEAQVRSAQAQVTQARATLRQAQVNLDKTVITAPIDGIVIARSVDVGQTVAASLQTPTLFSIAADLSRMQVKANIDESDLGQVTPGQHVTFTVDAYPNETFTGSVSQVRLNPVVEQNVVTYAAIITAANPGLKLKPGMTASTTIEVARRDGVLRVPSAALRFRPTAEMLGALGQGSTTPATATSGKQGGEATLWVFDGSLRPVTVRPGVSDGTLTEVAGAGLAEGTPVVTRVTMAASGTAAGAPASPLMPTGPRR